MSTGLAGSERGHQASALVAEFRTAGPRLDGTDDAWRLDRGVVADRLDELIAEPGRIRQGRLNLCGPAALFTTWFTRDPLAATRHAVQLFETGHSRIGDLPVSPSQGLRRYPYGLTDRARSCAQADWMLMASLRDSTNRVLRYSRPGGLAEPPAAITMPGAMRRWLRATGCYASIADETNLVLRKGIPHALALRPTEDQDVFLLVAMEMFGRPATRRRHVRDRVVSLIPNHWLLLRSPIRLEGDQVRFTVWSWGAVQAATLDRATFARCYYGAVLARTSDG